MLREVPAYTISVNDWSLGRGLADVLESRGIKINRISYLDQNTPQPESVFAEEVPARSDCRSDEG